MSAAQSRGRKGAIAGIASVHAPPISALPKDLQVPETSAIYAGFARLREWVKAYDPDLVIVLSSEHIVNFLRSNVPAFCVGLADNYEIVEEFNLPTDRPIPGDAEVGRALVEYGYDKGFDLSHSSRLRLDHGSVIPLHFLMPDLEVPVVPVIVNTIFPPFPTLKRSFELGRMIGDFVGQALCERRVLALATGGLAHSVGERLLAPPDYSFDGRLMEWFKACDIDSLLALSDEEVARHGNGTREIRCWLALQAMLGDARPEVVTAEEAGGALQMGMYQLLWDRMPAAA